MDTNSVSASNKTRSVNQHMYRELEIDSKRGVEGVNQARKQKGSRPALPVGGESQGEGGWFRTEIAAGDKMNRRET
jgi:hypothetical protein